MMPSKYEPPELTQIMKLTLRVYEIEYDFKNNFRA